MNKIKKLRGLVAVAMLSAVASVHAALPAGAETAIEAYETDVLQAMGLMISAGIAIFAVRKLGQKMGWW